MPADDIERLVAQPLKRFCQSTITSPQVLRRELTAIRARGWASSYEETNVGVWGIAVPVVSETDVVCAVGIAGPSPRLSVERVRQDVALVHDAAAAIGRALGLKAAPISAAEVRIGPAAARERSHA